MLIRRSAFAVSSVLALTLAAQAGCQPSDPPRIVTVGASVTAGFRLESHLGMFPNARKLADQESGRKMDDAEFALRTDSVAPGDVLSVAYGRLVETFGDTMLFFSPSSSSRDLLTKAFAKKPDCVLGIDLAFWFGYGRMSGVKPGTPESLLARLKLQQTGLALFDEFLEQHPDTTLVIGDYPDLTGCVPLMISPAMIPKRNELEELNSALAKWAAKKPLVHVFPLSKSLESLKAGECKITRDGKNEKVATEDVFQLARVHPTRLGVAVLTRNLTRWMVENLSEDLWPEVATDEVFVAASSKPVEKASPKAASSSRNNR